MSESQLQALLQAIKTLQDLGKVAYFNKGVYNSETNYERNDVVSYNGSSYVSLGNNNQGNLPTNTTYWSVVALKGDKGDTGKPFVIEKTYESIEDMVADYDNMEVNDYVMIQGDIEEEENATLWTKTETEVSPYKWVYLADFSGASGITGQTPNIQIGTVTEGNEPSVTRRAGSSNENPILDFVLKTGATGATGNGISTVSKTSTSGLTDTYTIAYTNGNNTTFDVNNGKGISNIVKTSTSGLVDTYTITYNDNSTSTFEITNGEDGEVTQAQLDETNSEIELVRKIYNAFPTTSDEDEEITLDGTAEVQFKNFELKGNTSQYTTTGKNISNWIQGSINSSGAFVDSQLSICTDYISVNNGDTFTSQKNIAFSGTNDNMTCRMFDSNKTYLASVSALGYNNLTQTITLNNADVAYVRFTQFRQDGLLVDNDYEIMVERGSTASNYEPFTGNQPSPNHDYPQDIQVVSGDNTLKVEGKNIANISIIGKIPSLSNGQLVNLGGSACTNYISIDNTKEYTFSFTTDNTATPYVLFYGENNSYLGSNQVNNSGYKLSNSTYYSSSKSVILRFDQYDRYNAIQLEVGNQATTYTPYVSQSYPINLGNIELCKINTYQDKIYKNNDKWYLEKKIDKNFENSFMYITPITSTLANNLYGYACNTQGLSSYSELGAIISNIFVPKILGSQTDTTNPNNVRFNMGIAKHPNSNQVVITIDKKYLDTGTTTEFSNFLNNNDFEYYCVLSTPTTTEITDNTLIGQLNALEKAYSYDTQTNISQINADKPFIINAEAIMSLKNIFNY